MSNEERIEKLEELLSKVEGRRDRDAAPAAEPEHVSGPEFLDLSESDDVIELTDEDELVSIDDEAGEEVVVEASEPGDVIPMIPEEFEEAAPEVEIVAEPEEPPEVEISAEPEAPMELEPLAPVEPGYVTPEALAAEPVEPIDVLPPGAPEIRPVEPRLGPDESEEITLELHPTEPAEKLPPPTLAMPVVPEPVEPEPVPSEPPPTTPQPVVPEPAVLTRIEMEAAPDMEGAHPAAFEGELPVDKPRTIGEFLRAAFRVGEK
ncbi:MAG: hypothetical protein JRG91_15020 [Deltaproteobacteria bacterium]|nr:hypothetical protein [Deltaproteobacteria bacterium]